MLAPLLDEVSGAGSSSTRDMDPRRQPAPPPRNPRVSLCAAVLGMRYDHALWGLAPLDMGVCTHRGGSQRYLDETHRARALGTSRAYEVPRGRERWGEEQSTLHAEWGDLLLDLVYVGAAYNLGNVMKYAFFECDDGSDYDPDAYGVRRLQDYELKPCVGIGYGILYSLAYFFPLIRCWILSADLKARFVADSVVHKLLDLVQTCALVIAAGGIQPARTKTI